MDQKAWNIIITYSVIQKHSQEYIGLEDSPSLQSLTTDFISMSELLFFSQIVRIFTDSSYTIDRINLDP